MITQTTDLLRQSNRVGVRFLIAEVETGLTLLSVAANSVLPERRDRTLRNAREVYSIVRRLLPRVAPIPAEKLELDDKLAVLRGGLIAAGHSPD